MCRQLSQRGTGQATKLQTNALANKDFRIKETQTDSRVFFLVLSQSRGEEFSRVDRQVDRAHAVGELREKTSPAEEGGEALAPMQIKRPRSRQTGGTQVEGSGLAISIVFFSVQ